MSDTQIVLKFKEYATWPTVLHMFLLAMRETGYTYLTLEHFARTAHIHNDILYFEMYEWYWSRGFHRHAASPLLHVPKSNKLGKYSGPILKTNNVINR